MCRLLGRLEVCDSGLTTQQLEAEDADLHGHLVTRWRRCQCTLLDATLSVSECALVTMLPLSVDSGGAESVARREALGTYDASACWTLQLWRSKECKLRAGRATISQVEEGEGEQSTHPHC